MSLRNFFFVCCWLGVILLTIMLFVDGCSVVYGQKNAPRQDVLCQADFDSSGAIDFSDFITFSSLYGNSTPSAGYCRLLQAVWIRDTTIVTDTLQVFVRDTIYIDREVVMRDTVRIIEYETIYEDNTPELFYCASVIVVDGVEMCKPGDPPIPEPEPTQPDYSSLRGDCSQGWRKGFLDFLATFDRREGEPGFDTAFDRNNDGAIDFSDFILFLGGISEENQAAEFSACYASGACDLGRTIEQARSALCNQ